MHHVRVRPAVAAAGLEGILRVGFVVEFAFDGKAADFRRQNFAVVGQRLALPDDLLSAPEHAVFVVVLAAHGQLLQSAAIQKSFFRRIR